MWKYCGKKIIETLDKIKNIEKELLILKNEYQEGGENKKIISIYETSKFTEVLWKSNGF